MITRLAASLLLVLQAALALRVVGRLLKTARAERIRPTTEQSAVCERVSVIVPVLNEQRRLQPCLDGLTQQGDEVLEILVVDVGSTDGTQVLVERAARLDPRIRLLDARSIPDGWNGKAWGQQSGLEAADPRTDWLLTVDADVRPRAGLVRALVGHARRRGIAALSVATAQEIDGPGTALVHPAMLTTLVYRWGIPGQATRRVAEARANGQCMLFDRVALEEIGGFVAGAGSLCEDITMARTLAIRGWLVGFYESERLASARMYQSGVETWRNWPRSLPLRDGTASTTVLLGLLEVLLVQALPGLLLALAALPAISRAAPAGLLRLNAGLAALRLGILVGMARAYTARPWSYWLSPLMDLPVALALIGSACQREHRWRGRRIIRGGRR
jgi:dolichol-phosphate mannosyltransferase